MKAKKAFYHDDPPCQALLNQATHDCEKCSIHPDTQSKAIGYHYPICNILLQKKWFALNIMVSLRNKSTKVIAS